MGKNPRGVGTGDVGGKEAEHAASRAVPEGGGLRGRWSRSPTGGKGLECYLWPTPTS